jgi:carbon monoxide dehydrogenase subunit G
MELNGDILIEAPRDRVWRALNNPDVLVRSIPGCEEVRQLSATETHVRVAIKLGPVRARFVGKILMSEVRVDEGCVLDFEGSGGAAGFAKGRSTVSLATEGAGTRLRYTAQASVGGKLGQIGGRLIDASAKQTADQFFLAFSEQLGAGSGATASETAVLADAASPAPLATATRPAAVVTPWAASGEGVRVLWFALGAIGTAFGFWVASALMHAAR